MKQVQPGDVIGSCECPGCGAQTPLKINRNGSVYFFCAKRVGVNPATGKQEACYTRMSFGRTGSKKMIEQFLEAEKDTDDVQHDDRQEANREADEGNREGSDRGIGEIAHNPVTASGNASGLVAGLKRFLTD